jgi:hypothetical protein
VHMRGLEAGAPLRESAKDFHTQLAQPEQVAALGKGVSAVRPTPSKPYLIMVEIKQEGGAFAGALVGVAVDQATDVDRDEDKAAEGGVRKMDGFRVTKVCARIVEPCRVSRSVLARPWTLSSH